jgi:hypothetical protein
MKATVSRKLLERFAQGWQAAQKSKTLPEAEFKALHARFLAADQRGAIWTIGVNTLKWHRADNGKWMPARPPETFLIDDDVLAELKRIIQIDTKGAQFRLHLSSGWIIDLVEGGHRGAQDFGLQSPRSRSIRPIRLSSASRTSPDVRGRRPHRA